MSVRKRRAKADNQKVTSSFFFSFIFCTIFLPILSFSLKPSQSCPHIIRRNQSKTHLFPKNNGLVYGEKLLVGNLRHSLTLNKTQQDAGAKLEVAFARANLLNKENKKKKIRKSKSTPYFRLNLYENTDSNENKIKN